MVEVSRTQAAYHKLYTERLRIRGRILQEQEVHADLLVIEVWKARVTSLDLFCFANFE